MPDSVREQVLARIMDTFKNATVADSENGTTWKTVLDSPYEGRTKKGQNILSVIEGDEQYQDVVSPDKRDRSLDIDLQTRAYVPLGTSLRKGATNVLADMEQIIEAQAETYWGGLIYATFLQANTVNREDTGDRAVELSLFLNVRYRAKRSNPYART